MVYRYRFLIVIALSLCAFSSKAGEGATLLTLPDSVICTIVSELDSNAIRVVVGSCNKRLRDLVNTSKEQSRFAVTVTDNNGERSTYFLEEYLSQPGRIPISEAKNLDILAKQRPKDFIQLLIKSIPNTPALRESSLKSFYEKIFPIAQLIASLPPLETPQEKLAGILTELAFWHQVSNQVWGQVWDQVWERVGDQVLAQVWLQAMEQISAQVGTQVREQVSAHCTVQAMDRAMNLAMDLAMNLAKNLAKDQVKDQILKHFKAPLDEYLRKYNFSEASSNTLRPMLAHAIGDLLMVYQLGSIPMRYSGAFKQIQDKFAAFILEKMTPEEAQRVINSDIPAPPSDPNNCFVQTELNMLRRCLSPTAQQI